MNLIDKKDPIFIDIFTKRWNKAINELKKSTYDLSRIKLVKKESQRL